MRAASPARNDGKGWWQHITEWLMAQNALLDEIERVSSRQREAVNSKDLPSLNKALDERGALVKRLESLHRSVQADLGAWDVEVAKLSVEDRALLATRVDAVSARVSRVIAEGAIDQRALESQRDAIASELTRLERGRGAVGAYGGRSPSAEEPKYQDEEA